MVVSEELQEVFRKASQAQLLPAATG